MTIYLHINLSFIYIRLSICEVSFIYIYVVIMQGVELLNAALLLLFLI